MASFLSSSATEHSNCAVRWTTLHHEIFPDNHVPGVQIEEGQWVAKERLREKLMPRVSDRPLVDFVLNIVPNKVTSKGPVLRYCLSHLFKQATAIIPSLPRVASEGLQDPSKNALMINSGCHSTSLVPFFA